MAKLNLSDLIDPYSVLEKAFEHPSLRVTTRTKKLPTNDDALKIVEKTIQLETASKVAEQLIPAMETMYLNYTLLNGEHGDADERGEWEAGLDDQVEALIEAYVPYLSADWLGNHTIACGLHEEDGIKKFCMSLGKEMYKQLTYDKTPAKVLSGAGITQKEVEGWLDDHIKTNRKETEPMDANDDKLQGILAKMHEHLGKGYDVMEVFDDIDLASDEDDVLAEGAAPRLGLDKDDVRVLQSLRFEHEDATPQFIFDLLQAGPPKEEKKKPASKKAPAKKKAEPKKETKATEEVEGDAIDPIILSHMKEYGGAKDTEMAKDLGVSRATYNNWIKGKGSLELDDDQKSTLRDTLLMHINALHEALGLLDGEEPIVVE